MTYSVTPLKRIEASLFIAWPLDSTFLVYICVSVSFRVSEKRKHGEDFSRPFQHTQCSEDLLPGITVRNVIGPHICWGSWRAEAATVQRPSHTWPGPLVQLVIGSRISCSHDAQCLIVLENQIPPASWKTSWRTNCVSAEFSFTQMLLKAGTLQDPERSTASTGKNWEEKIIHSWAAPPSKANVWET